VCAVIKKGVENDTFELSSGSRMHKNIESLPHKISALWQTAT